MICLQPVLGLSVRPWREGCQGDARPPRLGNSGYCAHAYIWPWVQAHAAMAHGRWHVCTAAAGPRPDIPIHARTCTVRTPAAGPWQLAIATVRTSIRIRIRMNINDGLEILLRAMMRAHAHAATFAARTCTCARGRDADTAQSRAGAFKLALSSLRLL